MYVKKNHIYSPGMSTGDEVNTVKRNVYNKTIFTHKNLTQINFIFW